MTRPLDSEASCKEPSNPRTLNRVGAISYGIVVHGGAGSPLRLSDGGKKACSSAFKLLKRGSGALEAVAEAARLLEDDGRFNAGSGSKLRLDDATVEMDAALMDPEGRRCCVYRHR